MKDLMFDLETLGYSDNCVVAAIAVVAVDFSIPWTPEYYDELVLSGFYRKLKVSEQIAMGRTMHADVIGFWNTQPRVARELSVIPNSDDCSLETALLEMTEWIRNSGHVPDKCMVWARGSHFDFPKIEHMYRSFNLELPFNTWAIRDTKTMFDVLGGTTNGGHNYTIPNVKPDMIKHHCLHDAAYEAYRMSHLLTSE